ncbi:MAG: glycosyltransferase family 2 protein [Acidimicrobiales bacterium]|nr:glycosyltransferase family 2 protein [Acidimicrobiales bacterium]
MSSTDDAAAEDFLDAAPPVVVIMVAHDPGWWFSETLASVAAQTYANWSALIVDAGSARDLSAEVTSVLPGAHLVRIEGNPGFGAAVNAGAGVVEGAAFYLICHDDVCLAPDAIQLMVEEAFRSNAGIVGPKIVDWHHPDQLLQVGMGADKTGVPSPLVERYELDQEQHDAVRDVFFVPGAATLVRADLFAELGGFDPRIDFHADDLDLCWRAHVAGARVLVAPAARVGHLEALGIRRPEDDRRRLQMRHRQRLISVNYGLWYRLRVVPQALVIALVEVVYSIVFGRFRQARDIAGAWVWNFRTRDDHAARRRALKAIRRVPDRDIRKLQVRGSARVSSFLRGQIGNEQDPLAAAAASGRNLADTVRSGRVGSVIAVWLAVLAFFAVGGRSFFVEAVPSVGEFASFPLGSVDLLESWLSGYREVGTGAAGPAPTALGAIGLAGFVLFGSMQLLRQVLIVGTLPLGAIGMWRLLRPIGSRRSKIVGLLLYVASPVPYNAMAQARWGALVVYALVPWMLAILAKASRVAPYGAIGGQIGPGVPDRPLVHHVVMLGVVTALAAMLVPFTVAIVIAIGLAMVLGAAIAGQLAGAARILVTAIGGAVVAVVLQLPWSLEFLRPDWDLFAGSSSLAGAGTSAPELANLLRFDVGPVAVGVLGWGLLGPGLLALLIGRDWRLAWASRAWFVALAGWGTVWLATMGWLPAGLPAVEVLLAPAAASLALAGAMGMAAFEVDLPDYHFGWRQIASVLAGAALLVGLLPALGTAIDGRWGVPADDFGRRIANLARGDAQPYRILWLGDSRVVPLRGWPVADTSSTTEPAKANLLVFATSDGGPPQLDDLWPIPREGGTDELGRAVDAALAGSTSRLGSLVAPMGVRFIVVPDRLGPEPASPVPVAPAAEVLAALDSQLDLARIEVNPALTVYANTAWGPSRAVLAAETDLSGPVLPSLAGASVALPNTDGHDRFSGDLEAGTLVYLAAGGGSSWQLTLDGGRQERVDALGWASAFRVNQGGPATLEFVTPPSRYAELGGQVLLWFVAILYLLRTRVEHDERRRLYRGVAQCHETQAGSLASAGDEVAEPVAAEPGSVVTP